MQSTKTECLSRARELIGGDAAHRLRYAALELRLCIELMTFEKLNSARKHLPASAFKHWQPPQAIRALMRFEPRADQGFKLFMSEPITPERSPEPTLFVGEHRTFSARWLRKHYNKLGSLLHQAGLDGRLDKAAIEEWRQYLLGVVSEIEKVQASSITSMWMDEMCSCTCIQCGERVAASRHYIETEKMAVCLNESCGAEYDAMFEGKTPRFALREVSFPCECKATVRIEARHLIPGLEAVCKECGAEYEIGKPRWPYMRRERTTGPALA